jgi:hypothetical protein
MSNKTVLFNVNSLIRECKKSPNAPKEVFSVIKRAAEKTYNTGGGETTYRELKAKVGSVTAGLQLLYESRDPSTEYITVTHGAIDPNSVPENERTEKRNPKEITIGTSVSQGSTFGELMDIHDTVFTADIEAKSADPKSPDYIKLYETKTVAGREMVTVTREINTGLKRFYSTKEKVPEDMRGKKRPDPKIELVLDFGTWPKNFGKSNQPKMIVYDYSKPIEGTKPQAYERAKLDDGTPVNETNAYLFMTKGSRIYRIIVDKKSVSISDNYVSNKNFVREMLIESSPEAVTVVVGDDGETTEIIPNTVNIDKLLSDTPTNNDSNKSDDTTSQASTQAPTQPPMNDTNDTSDMSNENTGEFASVQGINDFLKNLAN